VSTRANGNVVGALDDIRKTELRQAKRARERTGITDPAFLYGKRPGEIDPAFETAMQRLWDIGSIDKAGRADTDLRRLYQLIAKGNASLSQADIIKLGKMSEAQLRLLLPWLVQLASLIEAQDHVDLDQTAPPLH
jgi:hypothetical protein